MPPAPTIADLAAARNAAHAARARASASEAEIARVSATRTARLRSGQAVAGLDTRLAAASAALKTAREQARAFDLRLAELSNALITASSPEGVLATLDARYPIALLPVRIETRFFDNATTLRVRIYPDQAHIDQHEVELTDQEVAAGRAYWQARWTDVSDEAAHAAWRVLCASLSPRRGAWVVRALTPTNLAARGTAAAPEFPAVGTRASTWSRSPMATLLPDRWAVIGYRGGAQVFRKWSAYVPDSLAVAPSPVEDSTPLADDALPIDEATRWLVDFNEAGRVGMGVVVTAADLQAGFAFSQGLDRVLVLGVDWTLTPEQAAARLDALLTAHAYSDGVSFVPQGTPTNATEAARTPAEATRAELVAQLDPVSVAARVAKPKDTASELALALGLRKDSTALTTAPGAALREREIASHLLNALWESTFGYTLAQFWRPVFSDAAIDALRDHAVQFVAPFGPYAALRVGKQPYGVLPVISTSRYRAATGARLEEELARVLGGFRALWMAGSQKVARVGRSADPGKDMVDVLQQTELSRSFWFRYVYGPASIKNTRGLDALANAQDATLQFVEDVLRPPSRPELAGHAHDTRAHRLQAPLVAVEPIAAEAPLTPNYVRDIATLARSPESHDELTKRQDATAVLEALLAHAALRELHRTAMREIEKFRLDRGLIAAMPAQVALRTPELAGIEPVAAPPQGSVAVSTPGELSRLVIPALTGQRTVSQHLATRLLQGPAGSVDFRQLNAFLASLDRLASVSALELDRAARAALDCCAYRLDAWLTSLASRRLRDLRLATPAGIHVGGYGWVDDLRPDTRPDSLGYVHAPSLAHAATAAILRSGHLAHRDSEHDALNIDLRSDRVRVALHLLEGMAQGQSLAALLGYRFERAVRERGLLLAKYILPIRQLAPLRGTGAPPQAGVPLESVAVRDVVDGVALLDRFRTAGSGLFSTLGAPASDLNIIVQEVTRLADAYDAVSDLLVAESMHQAVLGNSERAGAALAAIDRQGVAPAPAVVRTPRTGRGYSQRVVVLLGEGAAPTGWPADARARAEPRLNGWIGRLLGSPARIRVAAQVGDAGPILDVPAADLGLSPLALVLAAEEGSGGQASELHERLVQLIVSRAPAPAEGSAVVLRDARPEGAPRDTIGLGALRASLNWLRALITGQRALDARDFALPQENPVQGVDATEIETRANALVAATTTARTAIETVAANAKATEAQLRNALLKVANVGLRGSVPRVPASTATGEAATQRVRSLREQAAEVAGAMRTMMTALAAFEQQFAQQAATQPPGPEARAAFHVERIRQVLGRAFPVLPRFVAVNGPELTASLAARSTLCDGDASAPAAWLTRLALVRPGVDRLARVVSAITLLRGEAIDIIPLQLPHVPGDRWLALPSGPAPSEAQVSLVAATSGKMDFARALAGFVCDAWNEVVPSKRETTGVSFHYDAPGARPPQAILLAVPPAPAEATWSLDALADTVHEAHDLARIRAVTAREVEFVGALLPAIYLPQSYSKDVPSVRFDRIALNAANLGLKGFDLLGKS